MKVYSLIFYLFLSTVYCTLYPSFAQEVDIGYSQIHPASPLYFLKTIRENIELSLVFTPRIKMLRQLEFATRRLRETKALISITEDLIPPTLERYISYINKFADKHEVDDQLESVLKDTLTIHLKVLLEIYDQVNSQRAKIFIRSTMYRLIKRADMPDEAKVSICDLFAKEASSSALNQTEQIVLLERSQKCRKID